MQKGKWNCLANWRTWAREMRSVCDPVNPVERDLNRKSSNENKALCISRTWFDVLDVIAREPARRVVQRSLPPSSFHDLCHGDDVSSREIQLQATVAKLTGAELHGYRKHCYCSLPSWAEFVQLNFAGMKINDSSLLLWNQLFEFEF